MKLKSALALYFSLSLLLSSLGLTLSRSHSQVNASGLEVDMVPVMEEKMEMVMGKRKLLAGSFQICAVCTCCGGAGRLCFPTPCCYAINCNIPNRPFGFCSFTPKTCNCFGCHL